MDNEKERALTMNLQERLNEIERWQHGDDDPFASKVLLALRRAITQRDMVHAEECDDLKCMAPMNHELLEILNGHQPTPDL